MEKEIDIIRSNDRGPSVFEWLNSRHTFSFGEYYNPKRMHFGNIRVINDDWIAPSRGFDLHPHTDMEIVTIVLSGELEHKDSLGNGDILTPGKIQAMSAGSGITHSEKNPSKTTPVHLLQIWILTDQKNHEPRYQDATFDWVKNGWANIVSSSPSPNGLWIHQESRFYLGDFDGGQSIVFPEQNVKFLLMVIGGEIQFGEDTLFEGDTVLITRLSSIEGGAKKASKLLIITTT
jgi:redox-sensitive bicupin YhaK (pirin superfamily)